MPDPGTASLAGFARASEVYSADPHLESCIYCISNKKRTLFLGTVDVREAMASLEVWLEGLRDGLKRGEFAGRGPIMLRGGSLLPDTELAVRVMLADLDHLDTLLVERRQDLLDDFQHLREQLG
jgi:hypothetical protein